MTEAQDAVRSLHTQLVDATSGYAEGMELADRPEMIVLFRELHDLHGGHARQIEQAMAYDGQPLDEGGSYMATVHKAVLTIRAALTGLEENVIPAIRDGEKRILSAYDEALAVLPAEGHLASLIEGQREALAHSVSMLEYRLADV
jgi:uncharacterized protein (TIGR02284 family)